jgi:hypothetical protein
MGEGLRPHEDVGVGLEEARTVSVGAHRNSYHLEGTSTLWGTEVKPCAHGRYVRQRHETGGRHGFSALVELADDAGDEAHLNSQSTA